MSSQNKKNKSQRNIVSANSFNFRTNMPVMRYVLACIALCISFKNFAQVGGRATFEFLNMTEVARVAAIGSENVSTAGTDVNMFNYNPAALNDTMQKQLSINYLPHYADTKKISSYYADRIKNTGTWGFGVQYMNYGKFERRNAYGDLEGEFTASDYAFLVTKAHTVGPFGVGATMKFVGSNIDSYNATAIMMDMGAMFYHPKADFNVGLVIKNVGFLLSDYAETSDSYLPFDLQLGASYKFAHAPLRLSITAHHLNRFDIVYNDPDKNTTVDEEGNEVTEDTKTGDMIMRHFAFGAEFPLGNRFHLRAGYNHLRRKELVAENIKGLAGWGFGAMLKINAFELNFTRSFYHVAGGVTMLTLVTDLNKIIYKRRLGKESTQ